jgi:succinyl-diaminopimelate desuccinylase
VTAEVIELTSALVKLNTANPPGREKAAAELVASYLGTKSGVEVELDPFEVERANLIARVEGRGGEGLLLSGHLDTVPADAADWRFDPYGAEVESGWLYGRGACDMKGAVAAMAVVVGDLAASKARPSGDLVLALTSGEETDSRGARRLVDKGVLKDIDAIVVGEPTRLDVGVGHKGALWVEAETVGVAAHGASPSAGVNAIMLMLEWLTSLTESDFLDARSGRSAFDEETLSVNMIDGGEAPNIVPDSCRVILDFRTLPGRQHSSLLLDLEGCLPPARISILRDCLPVGPSQDSRVFRAACDAVRKVLGKEPIERMLPFITDGSVFTEATAAPIVIFGPGDERLAHKTDERIAIDELMSAVSCYEMIARSALTWR